MKGKMIIEVSEVGVSISSSLYDLNKMNKLEILHAAARGLNMSDEDISVYCVAETIGLFSSAEQIIQCETDAQLRSLIRGEKPEGVTIDITELRRQANES